MKIHERLVVLRKGKGLTKRALTDKIGIKYSTYANYESGAREPDSDVLKTLSSFYDVSIDYILGITELTAKFGSFELDEFEMMYIKKYRNLDTHGKATVNVILEKEVERMEQIKKEREQEKKRQIAKVFTSRNKSHNNVYDEPRYQLPLYEYPASAGLGVFSGEGEYELVDVSEDIFMNANFGVRIRGYSMEPRILNKAIVWVRQQPDVDYGDICIVVIEEEGFCKVKTEKGFESLNDEYKLIKPNEYDSCRISGKVVYIENPE